MFKKKYYHNISIIQILISIENRQPSGCEINIALKSRREMLLMQTTPIDLYGRRFELTADVRTEILISITWQRFSVECSQ